MDFALELTKLFSQSHTPEPQLDMVCRLACKVMGASDASILMYAGTEDKLHCKGRYIDPENGNVSTENNPLLLDILENMATYDYIYAAQEKINNEPEGELYLEYKETVVCGEPIDICKFTDLLDFDKWISTYVKLKGVYRDEKYQINTGQETLSGTWYKELLLHDARENVFEAKVVHLQDCEDKKKFFFLGGVDNKLGLRFHPAFYAGLPLYARGRYFGILRFLFPKDKAFLYQNGTFKLTRVDSDLADEIAQNISHHLEINYFLSGYKRMILTSKKYSEKNAPIQKFLDAQCEALSEIIKSRGAIIRRWDRQKKQYVVYSFSQKLEAYCKTIKNEDSSFFDYTAKKFEVKKDLLGVYFTCTHYPFEVTEFHYYHDEDGKLKYKREPWKIPIEESLIRKTLINMRFDNIAIFPVPEVPKSFILFFNSENRVFMNKDVAMIYPALRNFGLDLKAREYTQKVERRMDIISNMHRRIADLLELDMPTSKFVSGFLDELSVSIKEMDIFPHHILWEYVSEILPDDSRKKEDRYTLRNITPEKYADWPEKGSDEDKKIKSRYSRHLEFPWKEFDDRVLNYFKSKDKIPVKKLRPIFYLNLEDAYKCFDLPFFSDIKTDDPAHTLVGIISFIYAEEDAELINTAEFFDFMEFFSNQLSTVWNNFQTRIADKIQDKIDQVTRVEKKGRVSTKKGELREITEILAEEFKVDLCCFYLYDPKARNLKLEASNLKLKRNFTYQLNNKTDPLTVVSYKNSKNIRIFGRRRLEDLADMEVVRTIEEDVRNELLAKIRKKKSQEKYSDVMIEHWLSVVIRIRNNPLGLLTMFRIKGIDESREDKDNFEPKRPPFSEYDTTLLGHIQKHIFNIIFARQTIQQRLEDMRSVLHQVIAPLNALVSHSDNVAEGITPRHKIPEKLNYINFLSKLSANYARNFQRILDLETGKITLYRETISNLRIYLIGIAIDFQPMIQRKCIHIHITPETPDGISLEVDKDLFDHVITNLVDNAVKYSFYPEERQKIGLAKKPRSPQDKENVLISAEIRNDNVAITISSWGMEISESEREKIFDREFRGEKALDRSPTGTGIGLYLAQEIIKLHGGWIDLLPGSQKYNTIFEINLPRRGGGGN